VVAVAVLGGGYYWFEHRPRAEEKETPGTALVIVTKSTNACISDLVRVTGFVVPRREAVAGVEQEGSKVADVLVREGETVADSFETGAAQRMGNIVSHEVTSFAKRSQ